MTRIHIPGAVASLVSGLALVLGGGMAWAAGPGSAPSAPPAFTSPATVTGPGGGCGGDAESVGFPAKVGTYFYGWYLMGTGVTPLGQECWLMGEDIGVNSSKSTADYNSLQAEGGLCSSGSTCTYGEAYIYQDKSGGKYEEYPQFYGFTINSTHYTLDTATSFGLGSTDVTAELDAYIATSQGRSLGSFYNTLTP